MYFYCFFYFEHMKLNSVFTPLNYTHTVALHDNCNFEIEKLKKKDYLINDFWFSLQHFPSVSELKFPSLPIWHHFLSYSSRRIIFSVNRCRERHLSEKYFLYVCFVVPLFFLWHSSKHYLQSMQSKKVQIVISSSEDSSPGEAESPLFTLRGVSSIVLFFSKLGLLQIVTMFLFILGIYSWCLFILVVRFHLAKFIKGPKLLKQEMCE